MTIFNPSKQKTNNRFIISIIMVALLGGGLIVFEYSTLAAMRAEQSELKKNIELAQVKNAEFKKELYTITSANKLEETALVNNLILERSPQYFTYQE